MRLLAGKPLLWWSIEAANASDYFDKVVCSSDSEEIGKSALLAGADAWLPRPAEFAADTSPDIQWVRHALAAYPDCHVFGIMRPTSPFRTADTIRRAVRRFEELAGDAHSMRAVQQVREHPYKMWVIRESDSSPSLWMWPLLESHGVTMLRAEDGAPYHSRPTQTLPRVYVQNSSLELVWRSTVENYGTISGTKIAPFFTEGIEGLAIDTEEDWERAERYAYLLTDSDRAADAAIAGAHLGY